MAIDATDAAKMRIGTLGVSVDAALDPAALSTTWTTFPPAQANTLNTADRIITRALNTLNTLLGTLTTAVNAFGTRFNHVIGDEGGADQAAFDALGTNLIQAFAAGPTGAGRFEHPQTVADTEWVISHGLNSPIVAVQVVDDSGSTVWGDVEFTDADTVTLTFSQAITGTAVVRR